MPTTDNTLHCPVTVGRATRMTAESFARLCKHKRERKAGFWIGPYFREVGTGDLKFKVQRRCEWCKGERSNWPPELEIIEISNMTAQIRHPGSGRGHVPDSLPGTHCPATSLRPSASSGVPQETAPDGKPGNCGPIFQNQTNKNKEENMATKCEICQKEITRLHRSHGLTLCGTCKAIMPGVTKHLPALVKMIRALGKTTEVAEMLGLSAAAPASTTLELSDLEAVVQDARETLVKALPPVPENLDDKSLFDIADLADEAAQHIADLTRERDKLADQIKAAGQERMGVWQTGDADPIDEALLRWAKRQHQAGRVRVQMEVVEVEP